MISSPLYNLRSSLKKSVHWIKPPSAPVIPAEVITDDVDPQLYPETTTQKARPDLSAPAQKTARDTTMRGTHSMVKDISSPQISEPLFQEEKEDVLLPDQVIAEPKAPSSAITTSLVTNSAKRPASELYIGLSKRSKTRADSDTIELSTSGSDIINDSLPTSTMLTQIQDNASQLQHKYQNYVKSLEIKVEDQGKASDAMGKEIRLLRTRNEELSGQVKKLTNELQEYNEMISLSRASDDHDSTHCAAPPSEERKANRSASYEYLSSPFSSRQSNAYLGLLKVDEISSTDLPVKAGPMADPPPTPFNMHEKRVITLESKVCYFRNMDLSITDLYQIMHDRGILHTGREQCIYEIYQELLGIFRYGIWSSSWFLKFVEHNVTAYNNAPGRVVEYLQLADFEKVSFWVQTARWNTEIGKSLYSVLNEAVRIENALKDCSWGPYLRMCYVIGCDSVWTYELQHKASPCKQPRDQIWKNISSVPDRHFPNRSPISEVPKAFL